MSRYILTSGTHQKHPDLGFTKDTLGVFLIGRGRIQHCHNKLQQRSNGAKGKIMQGCAKAKRSADHYVVTIGETETKCHDFMAWCKHL